MRRYRFLAIAFCWLVWSSASIVSSAQSPPPVHGTLAPDGAMDTFYRAAQAIVHGVEHVYHFTKGLVVHDGKGVNPFGALREGGTVVVHTMAEGAEPPPRDTERIEDDNLNTTEGVVTRIDRRKHQITIRFEGGKTGTYRLAEGAAADAGRNGDADGGSTRVLIYYSDESGRKVAHHFRRTS